MIERDTAFEQKWCEDHWLPTDHISTDDIPTNGKKPVEELPAQTDCPPLPIDIDFEQGRGAGQLVSIYTSHAASISPMTPTIFHDSAILWLTAVAIARRLVLHMPFGDVYPNLFIMWLARTTLYTKSTALEVARSISWRLFPHLLASADTTPEAFLSDLCGHEPRNLDTLPEAHKSRWLAIRNFASQRGQLLDEASGLLAGAGRDYNAGLIEYYLKLYDCSPVSRSTRNQGWLLAEHTYLSFLGASTPAAMAQHLTSDRLWSMGWWRRFAILTPEDEHPDWQEPQETEEPSYLLGQLRYLYERLPVCKWPEGPQARSVSIQHEANELWNRYNKTLRYEMLKPDGNIDDRLAGTYGALPTQALKVAVILAAMDWPEEWATPTIELDHIVRAIEITEQWRVSAHRALQGAATTEMDKTCERVLRQLGRFGSEGGTIRDLCLYMKDVERSRIVSALDCLLQTGEAESQEAKEGKRGRPTERYRVAR